MLFPPPGVRIRRTIETLFLADVPLMIAEHDSRRVLLVVLADQASSGTVAFAGSIIGLATAVAFGEGYAGEAHFWGPEEIWAKCLAPTSPPGCNILVQSVFYD